MSEQIAEIVGINKKLYITQFYAGKKSGLSLQLTPWPMLMDRENYVQLTKSQVQQLVRELQNWLGETELPWGPYGYAGYKGTRKQQKERAAALGLSDDEAIDIGIMSDEV